MLLIEFYQDGTFGSYVVTTPITVKKVLEHVSGVQQVKVDYASKTATVQFDDTTATVFNLTEATKDAGYPSSIKKEAK